MTPLGLSQILYRAHNAPGTGNLVVVVITGEPGSGKTSYALKVTKEVYELLGYNDPWRHAVEHTFVTFKQYAEWAELMLQRYREWIRGRGNEKYEKTPTVTIDDLFGQQLDRYSWHEKTVQAFAAIFNMIRSLTSAVLLTTPMRADIVRALREKANYIVTLHHINTYAREAYGYRRYMNVLGEEKFLLTFIDRFRVDDIPTEVRFTLEEVRAEALEREHEILRRKLADDEAAEEKVQAFIDKFCETGEGFKEKGDNLYTKYLWYVKLMNDRNPLTRKEFYRVLRMLGYESYRAMNLTWFRGIKLQKNQPSHII